MKKINLKKLAFKKIEIIALNVQQLKTINGGNVHRTRTCATTVTNTTKII
jgi:natural product precursor